MSLCPQDWYKRFRFQYILNIVLNIGCISITNGDVISLMDLLNDLLNRHKCALCNVSGYSAVCSSFTCAQFISEASQRFEANNIQSRNIFHGLSNMIQINRASVETFLAEVAATLALTSTPSQPNQLLHPQLTAHGSNNPYSNFLKGYVLIADHT